jgi:hypothetical protein
VPYLHLSSSAVGFVLGFRWGSVAEGSGFLTVHDEGGEER